MAELQLALLGTPQVTHDGVPLTGLVYHKSLALLVYLAVTGRPHSREALAGLLWGESTEANARSNLRTLLTELRRRVPSHVAITRDQVAFDRTSPYWLDVEAFDQRLGRALMLGAWPLTAEDAATLEEALGLVRGCFLEGLHVQGAPAFEEWVLLQQEHLRLRALRALDALIEYHGSQGAYAQVLDCADRLLAMEPAHEGAHRRKMSLLACMGQRAAALRQYAACCQALAAIDAKPGGEMVALSERIRAGEVFSVPSQVPAHNLPTTSPD